MIDVHCNYSYKIFPSNLSGFPKTGKVGRNFEVRDVSEKNKDVLPLA